MGRAEIEYGAPHGLLADVTIRRNAFYRSYAFLAGDVPHPLLAGCPLGASA